MTLGILMGGMATQAGTAPSRLPVSPSLAGCPWGPDASDGARVLRRSSWVAFPAVTEGAAWTSRRQGTGKRHRDAGPEWIFLLPQAARVRPGSGYAPTAVVGRAGYWIRTGHLPRAPPVGSQAAGGLSPPRRPPRRSSAPPGPPGRRRRRPSACCPWGVGYRRRPSVLLRRRRRRRPRASCPLPSGA